MTDLFWALVRIDYWKIRIRYSTENWKLVIHLLFRTYRFGVDNKWWNEFDSIFGLPISKRWNIKENFQLMRLRCWIGFIPREVAEVLFPFYARKYGH